MLYDAIGSYSQYGDPNPAVREEEIANQSIRLDRRITERERKLAELENKINAGSRLLDELRERARELDSARESLSRQKLAVASRVEDMLTQINNIMTISVSQLSTRREFLNRRILNYIKGTDEACSVCLENFSDQSGLQVLDCGHFLCTVCYVAVDRCPECRVKFLTDELGKMQTAVSSRLFQLARDVRTHQ